MDRFPRITVDPAVMGGRPCIRGIRVTVAAVLRLMAAGHGEAEILRQYPYLGREDLREVLSWAAWRADSMDSPLVRE